MKGARRRLSEEGARLPALIRSVTDRSATADDAVRKIGKLVQDALVHPPLLQPCESKGGYWRWRRAGLLSERTAHSRLIVQLFRLRLVTDPELLLQLGEGRCGQCVDLLCAALGLAGFKARPWQLPHHIVAEVSVNGRDCVVDADAFKNGIFLGSERELATKREIEQNPYFVDRFKPTGWMFRRDSVYARNTCTQTAYAGYIDFYSPEEQGQVSTRYGAPQTLLPPGVPRWASASTGIKIERGDEVDAAFTCRFPERARGFRFRCGRRSRGYAYDRLVPANLGAETSDEILELELSETRVRFRLPERGRYFFTAAAIPHYIDEFPSYVWWSDELVVDVV
jgi:hypothetical protein